MAKMNSSREDYLKAIFVLSRQQTVVRCIDLAHYLRFTKPSVSRAVSVLRDEGYLILSGNNHIYLTGSGREIAETMYARHCFFREKLMKAGVAPETADQEACRMEHVVSEPTFQLLVKAYGTSVPLRLK